MLKLLGSSDVALISFVIDTVFFVKLKEIENTFMEKERAPVHIVIMNSEVTDIHEHTHYC